MIQLKNAEQIALMREAGRITGEALCLAGEAVKEGISTFELDKIIRTHILQCGAKPSFLHYKFSYFLKQHLSERAGQNCH